MSEMKRALVISSQVASSSVGANASAFCLRRLGIETAVLPTTLLGRHPGWGEPGGALTPIDILRGMWNGIDRQNINFDAVLTGYMGQVDNVSFAAQIINELKLKNPDMLTVVDPVMGDNGQLYIPVDVAMSIQSELIPLADFITPNIWEFSHLIQRKIGGFLDLVSVLKDYSGSALITSAGNDQQIGGLLSHAGQMSYWGHDKFDKVPHGGGDALAGTFLAHLLTGENTMAAAGASVSSIFAIMKHAFADDASELPLTRYQSLLIDADPLSRMDIL